MRYFACIFALATVLTEVRGDCAGASQTDPLYRGWNSGGGDHFYTPNLTEYNNALKTGYTAEGIRASVFTTRVAGSVQFIRLWNAALDDHFYTINATEANAAVGYVIEDVNHMYIYPTQLCGSVPLYRSYNHVATDHFYTIDAAERDTAAQNGWAFELIAGYVFPPATSGSSGSIGGTTTLTAKTTTTSTATTTADSEATPAASALSNAPVPSSAGSGSSGSTDDGLSAPALPAPTTILDGSSLADVLPTSPATSAPGTGAARRLALPPAFAVAAIALAARLL